MCVDIFMLIYLKACIKHTVCKDYWNILISNRLNDCSCRHLGDPSYMNSSTSVQMASWWWGCQTCVATDVLSSCLPAPSLSRPWTTCGTLTRAVVVPQLQFSSSPSPPLRARSGPAGALHPAMTTFTSQAPASTSYTCTVGLLLLRALTAVQQAAGLAPPMGCRWNLACLRLPHPPHLLSSQHTSRHLAACCTPLPSSIPALSHSEGEKLKLSGTLHSLPCVEIFDWFVFTLGLKKPGQKVHLLCEKGLDLLPVLGGGLLICLNPLLRHLNPLSIVECWVFVTTFRCWLCVY